ncbi:hypothetical protein P7C70_g9023, partial [Phenoliferia sp. Uapishka_3]
MKTATPVTFSDLPTETLRHILGYLAPFGATHLKNIRLCNKRLAGITKIWILNNLFLAKPLDPHASLPSALTSTSDPQSTYLRLARRLSVSLSFWTYNQLVGREGILLSWMFPNLEQLHLTSRSRNSLFEVTPDLLRRLPRFHKLQ